MLLRTSAAAPRIRWEQRRTRSFFVFFCPGRRRKTAAGSEKGKSPREMTSPTATYCAGPATRTSISYWLRSRLLGIIGWIVLGLGAGLLANMLIPGRRSQGLILTCVIGVAGALLGGWLATRLFHVHTPPARVLQPVHLADGHHRRGNPAAGLPPGQYAGQRWPSPAAARRGTPVNSPGEDSPGATDVRPLALLPLGGSWHNGYQLPLLTVTGQIW